MTLLLGSLTMGLILALLGLGVYISFRIFNFADITADGSITLGAAVAAILITGGWNPLAATLAATLAGFVAGALTGVVHTNAAIGLGAAAGAGVLIGGGGALAAAITAVVLCVVFGVVAHRRHLKLGINGLLAGILVMTALYSLNLHIMGKSNVPLLNDRTVASWAEEWGTAWTGAERVNLAGWEAPSRDVVMLGLMLVVAVGATGALYLFLRTDLGTAMRATGNNPQMITALGVNTDLMIVLGLALSNALIALSGALLAQYQGFADVQMGIGMVVWGLASVIIGEALVGSSAFGYALTGAVFGSVIFREMVALALRWGMDPNDLKLVTAVFVFVALVIPQALRARRKQVAHA